MTRELINKPLVEAIFEMRWQLQGAIPGPQVDPHYKLLLGRLFDRIQGDYPTHEELPAANIPDILSGNVVHHRFRTGLSSWPLVQVGPGIFTVNSTTDYRWVDFQPRVVSAVKKLFEAHPKVDELRITNLTLRYIDAVDFDHKTDDTFKFLRDKLKLNIELPANLFGDTGVENKPNGFTWQCSFKCDRPSGIINIGFAIGQKGNVPAILWETTFVSTDNELPQMPQAFEGWLGAAHAITDDWFFKMIEGELERRFSGG